MPVLPGARQTDFASPRRATRPPGGREGLQAHLLADPTAFRYAASGVSKLMPNSGACSATYQSHPSFPRAYLAFVERSCRNAPVAVVLEDLHWAVAASAGTRTPDALECGLGGK